MFIKNYYIFFLTEEIYNGKIGHKVKKNIESC